VFGEVIPRNFEAIPTISGALAQGRLHEIDLEGRVTVGTNEDSRTDLAINHENLSSGESDRPAHRSRRGHQHSAEDLDVPKHNEALFFP